METLPTARQKSLLRSASHGILITLLFATCATGTSTDPQENQQGLRCLVQDKYLCRGSRAVVVRDEQEQHPSLKVHLLTEDTSLHGSSESLMLGSEFPDTVTWSSAEESEELCRNGVVSELPLVVLPRDYANLYHLLKVQLLSMHIAVDAFGLADEAFQLLLVDRDTHPEFGSEDDAFLDDFELLSGSQPLGRSTLPEVLCADTILLGLDSNSMFAHEFVVQQAPDTMEKSRAQLHRFVPWVMHKYGVQHSGPWQAERPIHVDLVLRDKTRAVLNMQQFVGVFSARLPAGHVAVHRFGKGVAFRDQLAIAARSSIYMNGHGAALGWMIFLPPGAVSVELMPYDFLPGKSFYWGFINIARMTRISHVTWHNRDALHSLLPLIPNPGDAEIDPKNSHTWVEYSEIHKIVNVTVALYETPPHERGDTNPLFLESDVESDLLQ